MTVMKVDVEMSEGSTTLRLRGELDDASGELVRECVAAIRPASGSVVIDLEGVGFIDSAGIWSLVSIHRSLELDLRRLELVGARGQVLRVLEMSGVVTRLELAM
jgi:anti-anti-sigma factor